MFNVCMKSFRDVTQQAQEYVIHINVPPTMLEWVRGLQYWSSPNSLYRTPTCLQRYAVNRRQSAVTSIMGGLKHPFHASNRPSQYSNIMASNIILLYNWNCSKCWVQTPASLVAHVGRNRNQVLSNHVCMLQRRSRPTRVTINPVFHIRLYGRGGDFFEFSLWRGTGRWRPIVEKCQKDGKCLS